jgi:hypothetical protein
MSCINEGVWRWGFPGFPGYVPQPPVQELLALDTVSPDGVQLTVENGMERVSGVFNEILVSGR